MLDNNEVKQEHIKSTVKFIDEYTQQNLTQKDYKLLYGICKTHELIDMNFKEKMVIIRSKSQFHLDP